MLQGRLQGTRAVARAYFLGELSPFEILFEEKSTEVEGRWKMFSAIFGYRAELSSYFRVLREILEQFI